MLFDSHTQSKGYSVIAYDIAIARNEESFPIALFDAIDAGENAIRVFRAYRRLQLNELAHRVGISQAYLSQIEHGTRKGSAQTMKKIAHALHVPMELLLHEAT